MAASFTNPLKGITNLGQWVSWDPQTGKMVVQEGGTWYIEDGRFSHHAERLESASDYLNAHSRLVTPGLVDPHTHPAFAATRELEFEMRSQGKSYQEIAAAGGGIRSSVKALREISESDLTALVRSRLHQMLCMGTTTVECKSGYGLETESELKSLRAIRNAAAELPMEVRATFLGAHEIPDEYRQDRNAYIDLIVDEMIPRITDESLAQYCDVFCEEGVYTPDETRRILTAAKQAGLSLRFHADEFVSTGGAALAAEIGAHSADHLMAISETGIKALAGSDTVATLLPGTTFFLGTGTWAPARAMIERGVTLALASDFNPGSNMSLSMPFIMTLAVIYLKLTPLEALEAATIGGARSLRLDSHVGALAPGYKADALLWNLENYRQIPYFYGGNQVEEVVVGGQKLSHHSF